MSGDFISKLLFKFPPMVRLVIVISGALMIHLTLGTYHTFGNMLPYMASYMRNHTDSSIRIEQMVWIPTFQGCFPFAMIIGGQLSLKIGPRGAAMFGCCIMSMGVFLSYFTIRHSFAAFLVTYGVMFGLGQGIAYVVAVSCVINWAPDRVGLVSGIVAAGFGVSSSIFAPIQTHLVNPWNFPATDDGYFTHSELVDRVPGVFITMAVVYACMQATGLVVVCDPPEQANSSRRRTSSRESGDEDAQRRENESDSESDDDDLKTLNSGCPHSMTPTEMLHSSTFYFLFSALFCCSFYANMFYNLYKTFAESFIKDDFFLAMAFSVGSVANAMARIGWGYLTDRTSFQMTIAIACCLASALLLSMPLTASIGKYAFFLWLILLFICMGATHALFITATVRCFGNKYKATNYGFLILSTTFSGVILSLVAQYFLTAIGYSWLFLITAVFPFCAFIVTSLIQLTPHGRYICY